MKTTKKQIKEMANFQEYTGNGLKINAIFFEYASGITSENKYWSGYKFAVAANNKQISKSILIHALQNWINTGEKIYTYYISYKFAENYLNRFKVPLSINLNSFGN